MFKKIKDQLVKSLFATSTVPRGLVELYRYFKNYGTIHFQYEKGTDIIVARSIDFRYGAIVTSGKNEKELEKNIKDAILTSFDVPSSYATEAKIVKTDGQKEAYALA